jgi:hypothetical protein
MEKFEDPIQKKFREKLEKSGIEFSKENNNRFLTKEEIEENKKKKNK